MFTFLKKSKGGACQLADEGAKYNWTNAEKLGRFKLGLKRWVLENIPVKPAARFQVFRARPPTVFSREVTPLLDTRI